MTDPTTTLAELKALQARFVDERDWRRFHTPRSLAMACAVEASELLELFLWVDEGAEATPGARRPPAREDLEAELADVTLCVLSLARVLDVDLAAAVERKVAANARKYPADVVRGRAEKYHAIHDAARGRGEGEAGG